MGEGEEGEGDGSNVDPPANQGFNFLTSVSFQTYIFIGNPGAHLYIVLLPVP
jgi:hypothetical protein